MTNLLRTYGRRPYLWLNHFVLAAGNVLGDLIVFSAPKSAYFRLAFGFRIGRRASIGVGTRFYATGNLAIGRNTVINRDCLIDNRDRLTIGDNVSISREVIIFTAGHNPRSATFEFVSSPVVIKDYVAIFARAMISPGVTLGEGCVVYPGSIVTRDVPANAIVAGSPAKVVGQRPGTPVYVLDHRYPLAM